MSARWRRGRCSGSTPPALAAGRTLPTIVNAPRTVAPAPPAPPVAAAKPVPKPGPPRRRHLARVHVMDVGVLDPFALP